MTNVPVPIRLLFGVGKRRGGAWGARGLGNLVRPVSPPGTRFPGAVGRPGGQAGAAIGDHAIRAILGVRSPRSTPPSFPYLYLRTVNTHGITMNEV